MMIPKSATARKTSTTAMRCVVLVCIDRPPDQTTLDSIVPDELLPPERDASLCRATSVARTSMWTKTGSPGFLCVRNRDLHCRLSNATLAGLCHEPLRSFDWLRIRVPVGRWHLRPQIEECAIFRRR